MVNQIQKVLLNIPLCHQTFLVQTVNYQYHLLFVFIHIFIFYLNLSFIISYFLLVIFHNLNISCILFTVTYNNFEPFLVVTYSCHLSNNSFKFSTTFFACEIMALITIFKLNIETFINKSTFIIILY